jgi:DNA-binding transcriptional LysR family regulator
MQQYIAKSLPHINWSDLHIVLTVARAKSVRKAAILLKTTESTVSRHISAVESSLGFSIFERTPIGMVETTAGERLVQRLARAEVEIETGLEKAVNQENAPKGKVRLTTVPVLMNHLIIPAAKDFFVLYPEVELELVGLPLNLSMMRRETDIAIRMARPSSELEVITQRIGHLEYAVFSKATANFEPSKNRRIPWVTYEESMACLPQAKWIAKRAQEKNEPISMLRCNDADGLVQAIRSEMGKTLLPKLIARNISDLKEIPNYDDLPSRELWLIIHPNIAKTKRIRVLIDWLKEVFI